MRSVKSRQVAGSALGWLAAGLNREYHRATLRVFMMIVLAHWAEHVIQAAQIWGLGWDRAEALGLLGLPFPWLVTSEWLHYGYALVMLCGLWLLRGGFIGRGRRWWTASFAIQVWHHLEHLILLAQAVVGANLLGRPLPVSLLQLVVPRVELHLLYNAAVFVPMVVALHYHLRPSPDEYRALACSCRPRRSPPAVAVSGGVS